MRHSPPHPDAGFCVHHCRQNRLRCGSILHQTHLHSEPWCSLLWEGNSETQWQNYYIQSAGAIPSIPDFASRSPWYYILMYYVRTRHEPIGESNSMTTLIKNLSNKEKIWNKNLGSAVFFKNKVLPAAVQALIRTLLQLWHVFWLTRKANTTFSRCFQALIFLFSTLLKM